MPLTINHERIEDDVVHKEFEAELGRLKEQHQHAPFELNDEASKKLMDHAKQKIIQHTLMKQEVEALSLPDPAYEEVQNTFEDMRAHFGGNESFEEHFDGVRQNNLHIKKNIELHLKINALMEMWAKSLPPPSEDNLLQFYGACKKKLYGDEPFEVVRDQVKKDWLLHNKHRLWRSKIKSLLGRATIVDSVAEWKGRSAT